MKPVPLDHCPTVSVVVPCYNYGRYLPDAVNSALGQEGVAVEVIIVDDCSTDGSRTVARDLAEADTRVRLIEHPENLGHIATYNDGLAAAAGDYVVLLSADDVLPRGSLGRAAALMEVFPSVGLVYGDVAPFVDTPPATVEDATAWSVYSGREWLRRVCSTAWNPITNPEVVMRREAWEQAGPYDPRLPHAADLALWIMTAKTWDIGRVNGSTQGFYRHHGLAMHVESGTFRDLRERQETFEIVLREDPRSSIAFADLYEVAARAMAKHACRLARGIGWWDSNEPPVADLRAFARSVSPGVVVSPHWWLPTWVRQRGAETPAATRSANALYERVRFRANSLRWQI